MLQAYVFQAYLFQGRVFAPPLPGASFPKLLAASDAAPVATAPNIAQVA